MADLMKKPSENDLNMNLLSSSRIAIFGLGLMGGSIAKALQGKCREIVAIDPDEPTVIYARENRIADHVTQHPDEKLQSTNLIVLAAPIQQIIDLIGELPALHNGSPCVMDLGSTKATIVKAMQLLPTRFDPIGGHPMCGKEKASIKFADRDLFSKAPFPLVPLERTSDDAKTLAKQIVEAVGAVPVWLDAETHDNWTAKTSHLPYLISNSLAAVTPLDAASVIGPGFRSSVRLAGSQIEMMMDILVSNRSNILKGLRDYRSNFLEIIEYLEKEDYQSLQELLVKGEIQYNKIIANSG